MEEPANGSKSNNYSSILYHISVLQTELLKPFQPEQKSHHGSPSIEQVVSIADVYTRLTMARVIIEKLHPPTNG